MRSPTDIATCKVILLTDAGKEKLGRGSLTEGVGKGENACGR